MILPTIATCSLCPEPAGWRTTGSAISSGGINFQGSEVDGWYREGFTTAQEQARDRGQRWQDCIDAAHNGGYNVPSGNLIAVITSPGIDLFGYVGVGSFLPDTVDMGAMTHEVGHGLGYQHSLKYRIDAMKQGQPVVLDFHPQAGLIHDVTPGRAVARPWTMPVEPPSRMQIRNELERPR